jgi:signal transduction histidine kinase
MEIGSRWRADLARPEAPTSRDEAPFHLLAPLVIIAIAQVTDPGSVLALLLLVPAALAFALRVAVPTFPAEAFAVLVIVPVTAAIGLDGDLEAAFFLSVVMVLYAAWSLGSLTRAVLITAVAAVMPWVVARHLAPGSGIGWNAWATAYLFTFVLGRTLQRQRRLIDQLEAARRALAEQAVSEERRRIARELHDLAGHTLAAVLLHVTGARHVLRRDPAEAEAALRDAEAVGRTGLDQVRAVVAALRTDERGTDRPLAGAADLPALIADYRRAGLSIEADVPPDAAGIDGPVGTALHRIAGEALTNVARHAPSNRVELTVCTSTDGVHLSVVDRGRPAVPPGDDGLHFGLVGMRERARALGGEVAAGPTADGWRVDARLPLPPHQPEPSR